MYACVYVCIAIACAAVSSQFIYSRVKGTPFLKHGGQGVNEIRLPQVCNRTSAFPAESHGRLNFGFIPCNFP